MATWKLGTIKMLPSEVARPVRFCLDDIPVTPLRRQLIVVATSLFAEKGYHETSVRDIAGAAGWKMSSLYHHGESKINILFLVCHDIMRRVWYELQEYESAPSWPEEFERAMRAYLETVERNRRGILFVYRESMSLPLHQREMLKKTEFQTQGYFGDLVRRGVEAGEFKEIASCDALGETVLILGHAWAQKRWAFRPHLNLLQYAALQSEIMLSYLKVVMPGVNMTSPQLQSCSSSSSTTFWEARCRPCRSKS